DDDADQKRDQRNNRDRGDSSVIHVPRDRGRPQSFEAEQTACGGGCHASEKSEVPNQIASVEHRMAPKVFQRAQSRRLELLDRTQGNRTVLLRAGWTFTPEGLINQAQLVRRGALEGHFRTGGARLLDEL